MPFQAPGYLLQIASRIRCLGGMEWMVLHFINLCNSVPMSMFSFFKFSCSLVIIAKFSSNVQSPMRSAGHTGLYFPISYIFLFFLLFQNFRGNCIRTCTVWGGNSWGGKFVGGKSGGGHIRWGGKGLYTCTHWGRWQRARNAPSIVIGQHLHRNARPDTIGASRTA